MLNDDPNEIDYAGSEDDATEESSEQHPSSTRSFNGVLVIADMFQGLLGRPAPCKCNACHLRYMQPPLQLG